MSTCAIGVKVASSKSHSFLVMFLPSSREFEECMVYSWGLLLRKKNWTFSSCEHTCAVVDQELDTNLLILCQGHYAEAIACYNEVMRVDPMAADGLVNRGNTLKEIGRVNDAIQDYIHAITIRPTMAEGHANLASAYKDRLCLNLGTFRLICNYWLLNNLSGYCEWTRGALMGSRFCPIEVQDSLVRLTAVNMSFMAAAYN